jgi:ubiquinone/menaquinone biosynthesis C-methylase UbiE
MATRQVAAEFDQISTVYDRTRDPLERPALEGLLARLESAGVASMLEIGVGTGRIARPLLDHGLEMTGLDASRGMMARAQVKGIRRLVQGSGYRLPFPEQVFDGSIMVHVLHLLDRPGDVLREAARVSRIGVYALVHARPGERETPPVAGSESARRVLREVLREQGFPVSNDNSSGPWVREPVILERFPPDRLDTVADVETTETLGAALDRLSLRGHRNLLKVPPEILDRAIRTARERVGDRTVTYRHRERLAFWDREHLLRASVAA